MKYEWKVVMTSAAYALDTGPRLLVTVLNELEQEGWEIFTVLPVAMSGGWASVVARKLLP